MATSIRRSPLIASRPSKAYRLEMEGRTLLLLLSLLGLTGVVVFSLGVVTGMGMRVPEGAVTLVTQPLPPGEDTAAGNDTVPAFEKGLTRATPTIEGLKLDQAEVSEQTRNLVERAERVLKLEEVPIRPPKKTKAALAEIPAARRIAQRPAPGPARAARGRFTVQVFSSQNRGNARDLMAKLKKLGFDAYLNQYQGADRQTWFRVRVGKTSRSLAEQLVNRLRDEAKLNGPRIVQL